MSAEEGQDNGMMWKEEEDAQERGKTVL